jgi:hypothetical protein
LIYDRHKGHDISLGDNAILACHLAELIEQLMVVECWLPDEAITEIENDVQFLVGDRFSALESGKAVLQPALDDGTPQTTAILELLIRCEAKVRLRGADNVRFRRFLVAEAEAPDADARKDIACDLRDKAFLALCSMCHEIPNLTEAFLSVMPVALAKEEPVEILDAVLSCQQPPGAQAKVIINHNNTMPRRARKRQRDCAVQ